MMHAEIVFKDSSPIVYQRLSKVFGKNELSQKLHTIVFWVNSNSLVSVYS